MGIKVTIPHDPLWLALDWAKKYCPSYITNDVSVESRHIFHLDSIGYKIDYFFSDEKDALMFMLKWS